MEKVMTVGDLKRLLQDLPDNMEILNTRYSDYDYVYPSEWSVVEGVPEPSCCWVTQAHHSMGPEKKARIKKYLHLAGN